MSFNQAKRILRVEQSGGANNCPFAKWPHRDPFAKIEKFEDRNDCD
jgi:hypothetical protein